MTTFKLITEERKDLGRKAKSIRKEGFIPANIFGKDFKSKSIKVSKKEFEETFKKAGETSLIELALGKESYHVLVANIQKDPISENYLHIDFRKVNLSEKINAKVPVVIVGESPVEKSGLGTLVVQLNEIEVEALPTNIPEKFEIDANNMTEVDQAIFVKDLKVEKDVTLINPPDSIVAKVEPLQKEIVEEVKKEEVKEEGGEVKESEEKVLEGQEKQEKEEVAKTQEEAK